MESVRDILEAGAEEGEETGTLPQASVDALYDSGLLRLKMPWVLGGAEADLVTQLDVLEAVCEIEPSAGWCLMIGAASMGGVGAFLPDDAIEEIFANGKPPRTAGVFAPFGKAVPVDGGYLLSGRWSFASGIRHSNWISCGARVVTEDAGHPVQVRATVRTADVKVHDNWHVMGLRGTGSCDFSVEDLFVPTSFAYDVSLTEPLRGGAIYRLGRPGFVTNEHSAFALGVARRALNTALEVGQSKTRGYTSVNSLARRPTFQRMLSEADLRLRATRLLNVEVLEEASRAVNAGYPPDAAAANGNAQPVQLHHRHIGGHRDPGVPLRWRRGPVRRQHPATLPARYQRRRPAPDGQRHRLREPRPIHARPARRQDHGITKDNSRSNSLPLEGEG